MKSANLVVCFNHGQFTQPDQSDIYTLDMQEMRQSSGKFQRRSVYAAWPDWHVYPWHAGNAPILWYVSTTDSLRSLTSLTFIPLTCRKCANLVVSFNHGQFTQPDQTDMYTLDMQEMRQSNGKFQPRSVYAAWPDWHVYQLVYTCCGRCINPSPHIPEFTSFSFFSLNICPLRRTHFVILITLFLTSTMFSIWYNYNVTFYYLLLNPSPNDKF